MEKSCLLCRTGATWDKQHGVDVERQRLLAQTRDLVNKGLQADHLWHTATHADYARPMLQVLLLTGDLFSLDRPIVQGIPPWLSA